MPNPPPCIISDQARLEEYCRRWRGDGRFAFDTEFIRDDTYDAVLCLVQVCDAREVVLIDPTGDIDIARFWELVCDPALVKIVHAGKEDFDVCMTHTGAAPRNVFDVQIAAGFVGIGYPMSLARLVQHVLGRRLSKGQTLTDWLRRPLTAQQLRYAVDDVRFLPELHARLSGMLAERRREPWAREEFDRFENPQFYQRPVADRLGRVKGASRLDARGLALLERLVAWRDRWAQERNRPARAMMRDDVMVEIARRRPREASDLEVMRGFHQSRQPKIVGEVLRLVEEAHALPDSALPQPAVHVEESQMERAAVDLLSAAARAICFEEGISHELFGSAQRLRELLKYSRERAAEVPALLRGWRGEFVGQRLLELLEGRCELHFSGWPDNPRLEAVRRAGVPGRA